MKYIYQEKDGDRVTGLFDSVDMAMLAARAEYRGCEETVEIEVFDCVQATEADRSLFEDNEELEIDFEKPFWWDGLWVPNDIVHTETISPFVTP